LNGLAVDQPQSQPNLMIPNPVPTPSNPSPCQRPNYVICIGFLVGPLKTHADTNTSLHQALDTHVFYITNKLVLNMVGNSHMVFAWFLW
jgi:hypothetical protein